MKLITAFSNTFINPTVSFILQSNALNFACSLHEAVFLNPSPLNSSLHMVEGNIYNRSA